MRPPLALAATLLVSCGPAGATGPRPVVTPDPDHRIAAPVDVSVQAASGATSMEAPCTEGAAEACDAIDDDCDGRVDEGCDYGGDSAQGRLEVTAAWNSDADVDLRIHLPDGEVLDSAHPAAAPDGLRLDHDGAGGCRPGTHPRRARAAQTGRPAGGRYRVAVRYADACEQEPAPPTTVTVSLGVDGTLRGVFNVTLPEPGAEADVAELEVAEW